MYQNKTCQFLLRLGLLVLAFAFEARTNAAQLFAPESAGLRYGVSANENGRDFSQAEVFLNTNLPWLWNFGQGWGLQSQGDLSLGWLGTDAEDSFVGRLGLSGRLFYKDFPVSITAGTGPTVLSHYEFEDRDFGSPFQFTTYVGANLDLLGRFRMCYRFQHMSNAGLAHHNPGLNLHVVGVSYLF